MKRKSSRIREFMTDHEFNLRYAEWLGKEWEPGDKDFERRTARHFYDLGHQEALTVNPPLPDTLVINGVIH